jgi:hypothetical protein
MKTLSSLTVGVFVTGLMSTSALAQNGASTATTGSTAQAPTPTVATAPESAPPKRVTVTTGLDFTSAYMFRGIRQHSGGTIMQPYVDFGIALGSGITANAGNWDSVHSTAPNGNWYESDYYGSLTFTAGRLKPGLLYTSYTSPADSFATVKELAGVLAVDDSSSAFPLSPKAIVAFELGDGQADAGAHKGVYLELGVKPAVKLAPKLTLYIPVKGGFSLKDYYEGPLGNNGFGYFDTGFQLSAPAITGKNGTLELHGGLDFLWLGDNLKLLNNNDGFRPVVAAGFTYTY